MPTKFKIGDKVTWNSEAGHVRGRITGVHRRSFKVNGYTRHATKVNPQYSIKSLISNHVAHHFASALKKIK
jgi:hypothetical protein